MRNCQVALLTGVAVALFWAARTRNRFIHRRDVIEGARSGSRVAFKRRLRLNPIPSLIGAVTGWSGRGVQVPQDSASTPAGDDKGADRIATTPGFIRAGCFALAAATWTDLPAMES